MFLLVSWKHWGLHQNGLFQKYWAFQDVEKSKHWLSRNIYIHYNTLYMILWYIYIYSIGERERERIKRDLVLLLYARRTWCNIIKMLSRLLIHSMRRKFISIDSQSFPSTFGPGFRPLELLTTHRHGHRDGTCGFFAWSPEDGGSIGGDGFLS